MKILIVDDEPVSREVLCKIVSGQNTHQVTAVADATAAWALLDDPSRYFDVAFIDLSMPGIDGYQLVDRIRKSSLLSSLAIVVCSGSNDRASLLKAVQLGVRHYIVKPPTPEIVHGKLNQIRPPEPALERRLTA